MGTEESVTRCKYLQTGRTLAVARHELAQHRRHRAWLVAGAGSCSVPGLAGGAMAWFVHPAFIALSVFSAFAFLIACICVSGAVDDVRRASKQEFRAKLDYEEASAEYLGIDPPMPQL